MMEEDYRHLASNIRANAELITAPYEKRTLLLIAQRYDLLADHAARRGAQENERLDRSA